MTKTDYLKRIELLAFEKNGICLSEKYLNSNSKLKFKCAKGHLWEANPNSIVRGSWCAICSRNKRLDIEYAKNIATQRDGKCLSNKYVNAHKKLIWKCNKGHKWSSNLNHIKNGTWCPICGNSKRNESRKLSITEMKKLAASREGECLSENYINARTSLIWKCSVGHEWKATPYSIKHGSWCPKCKLFLGEEIVRIFFEQIFNKPFVKSYPKWLNGLELDGYNEELKVAFEHHGDQHYQFNKRFHGIKRNFKNQLKRDELKIKLCNKHNVKLVVIPSVFVFTKMDKMKGIIKKELIKSKIGIPKDFDKIEIDLSKIYVPIDRLKGMQLLAEAKGGKCLSTKYLSIKSKLEWQCKNGHNWEATADSIKAGNWCSVCSNKKKKTIEEMKFLAKSKNGECLSTNFVNMNSKLTWKCDKGHVWEAIPSSIHNSNKWCPICARDKMGPNKLSIEIMQKRAKLKKGKCLSDKYVNAKTKLKWQCEQGHVWMATPDAIHSGSWCSECARNK